MIRPTPLVVLALLLATAPSTGADDPAAQVVLASGTVTQSSPACSRSADGVRAVATFSGGALVSAELDLPGVLHLAAGSTHASYAASAPLCPSAGALLVTGAALDCGAGVLTLAASVPGVALSFAAASASCSDPNLRVQVDPPYGAGIPVGAVQTGATAAVACVGTVIVTLETGNAFPAAGFRAGDCAQPPCAPWTGLPGVASCAAGSIACCTPLAAPAQGQVACLRDSVARVHLDHDEWPEVVAPIKLLVTGPCP